MTSRTVQIPKLPATQASLATVLTVAGSDSSGGAGIEADVKTITAHGCYALTAVAALTAQNTQTVNHIEYTSRFMLNEILKSNFEDVRIDVIKTGLLTEDAIDLLADYVEKYHRGKPMVIDPVMVATSGARLSKEEVLQHGIDKLMQGVSLITPNLEEATKILKLFDIDATVSGVEDLEKYARIIQEKTKANNVLLKGGHCPWLSEDGTKHITDVLYISSTQATTVFKSDYVDTDNTHGTGCTLASAIASNLASGLSLEGSVENGIRYVQTAINSASKLGLGNGPLNHVFHVASPAFKSGSGAVFVEGGFVDYLTSHPSVKPVWKQYLEHPFVEKVANGTLPMSKFVRYISQDYPYLVNYSRIHAILCSIAPDHLCMTGEIEILNAIKREMSRHENTLENKAGITKFDNMEMSDACREYSQYLHRVAKGRDWLEICVAMAPCLLGYYYSTKKMTPTTDVPEFKEWIETYSSQWYHEAVKKGEATLERHSPGISFDKAARLVKIFGDVCVLEVNFWNDALNYEE